MITIISPYNGQHFNIELKGSEESLKDLLGTIMHIPASSIKGIKDNYNNYYTLSSALKSNDINIEPNNYFSIIKSEETNNNDIMQSDINNYNFNKNYNYMNPNLNNLNLSPNQFINNSDIYYNNIKINNIQNYGYNKPKLGQYGNFFKQYKKEAYYNLIDFLYQNKYIGSNNYYKLKKYIDVNNNDVIEILKPFIEFDNNYNKLINNLFPILNLDLSINRHNMNKDNKSPYFNLLESLSDNFTRENMKKLNYLFLIENISIMNLFKTYYQTYNKKNLIDGLYSLLKRVSNVDLNKSNHIMGNILRERKSKSQNYKILQKGSTISDNNIHSIKHHKEKKKKYNTELLEKITDKILKYGKGFSKDIYYLMKYELSTIKIEEKVDIFINKFNIDIYNKKSYKEFTETTKKNIKHYYKKYIEKNIYKFLDPEEKELYLDIIKTGDSSVFNDLMKIYSDLIKDDKMKNKMELLRNKIINYLKDINKIIEENDKNNSNITETNRENFGHNELVFQDDEEEEEEDDDEDSKNQEEKNKEEIESSESSAGNDEEESENYDNADEESGVSIKKARKKK
jgi:hypothetical protein